MSSAAVTAASSVTSACGEHGAITEFADGLLTPEVEDDHLRAGVEQPLGGGQAQAGRATGDDGYGVFDLH